MTEVSHKNIFLHSLKRCEANADFVERFYDRFLASSEEVKAKFRFTDFEKQKAMLKRSLELSAAATNGDATGLQELKERARTHDKYHLDIRPEFYDLWLESILETAKECDPDWNEGIKESWETILGFVINYMKARH